ncbi:MAG TPA: sulfatase-like hydrolase/transferase [Tepidisphaeraceae bacterium]|nr:sulfatase-like hydrolase/transferase [Tepidisphaeraceae bacterium]
MVPTWRPLRGIAHVLILLLLSSIVAPVTITSAANAPKTQDFTHPQKPNVLFILVDDLGYGDVGVFYQNARNAGEPRLLTPALDRLAAQGVILTNHYCAAPVCASSRGSILQGLNQGHCAIRDNQFDKALPPSHTLGTVMKAAGYYTAAVGKWGVGGTKPPWPGHPLNRGFDEYYGFLRHGDAHNHYAGNHGGIYDRFNEVNAGIDGTYDTDLFTARAKRLIREHVEKHAGQPFFVYLAYTLPHFKMQLPPGPYPEGGGLHGGLQWPLDPSTGKPDSYVYPEFRDRDWPDKEKRHASMIHRLDDCVGDVLRLLDDLKIANNTLVIFTSDNGPHNEGNDPRFFSSWGPFDGIKRDLFEGGSREPTIVRWPGVAPVGETCDEPSAQYDWMPTLADAAGLPSPACSDGISLLPAITGHPHSQRHHAYLYSEYNGPMVGPLTKAILARHGYSKRGQMQSVRIGNFVGVRYEIKTPADPLRLYNVNDDPKEARDLSGDTQYAALLTRMRNLLLTARTPDPDARRPYDDELLPAVAAPPATGALNYGVFAGQWPWLPDFRAMTPVKAGQTPGFSLPADAKNGAAGVEFTGVLRVPADGQFVFTLKCDSGAALWVHDSLVIDDDYTHDGSAKSGSVRLAAGWHPVRLAYRHAPSAPAAHLEVSVRGPDHAELPLRPEMFGH